VTYNTGKIEGGGPNNQVPDVAVVRFNIRAPDEAGRDWALLQLEQAMAVAGMRDGIHTHLHGGFTRPPKPVNAAQGALFEAVAATGRAIGLEVRFKPSGGVCEGNNLFAHGVPNVDSLGVRGGRIHSSEEFLYTESLLERARLSLLLLNRLADGRMDAVALRALMGQNRAG
jgi:glutamate carboxypeptidase